MAEQPVIPERTAPNVVKPLPNVVKPAPSVVKPAPKPRGPVVFEKQGEIRDRDHFGMLCNARGLMTGNAVEVGTDRGEFAIEFLRTWRGPMLYCVDPYQQYHDMSHDREADRALAISGLARFGGRVQFRRELSSNAVSHVLHPVVFAYLDGSHRYPDVLEDCRIWWKRLAPNAIMAGHDIDKAPVAQAVSEFAAEHDLRVWRVGARVGNTSWYIYRDQSVLPLPWDVGGWTGRRGRASRDYR